MDFHRIYDALIDRARGRILEGYQERHHVIPKSIGGNDESSNIVVLTAEEHYIAHLLLVKMYPKEPKLVYAAWLMQYHHTDQRMNNKRHGWLKRKLSSEASIRSKQMWKNKREQIVESMIAERNSIAGKQRMKNAARKKWNSKTEEERAAFKETMTIVNKDEEKRAAASSTLRDLWSDPEFKTKMKSRKTRGSDGSALKAKWADPEWKTMMLEARRKKREAK
jgi:hypothetical protein